ncbi:Spy/CpxP family protein refolding chaperone [Vibrio coralliirubri]|uniref:Spy/CpxP family protein refolding chaperone n=1 Tax=Vibrio coralliirubri TaxID=1516159 RepID=UPI0022846B8C|nr:Spy/CpxP family protein refolding chaperone [Vibrio coralliirubri]MCY9865235.1 Spy/CpxP family protein refolding chaperone [Vibrio coralliirubri]
MKSLKKSLCVLTASALLVTAPFVSASSPQQPPQPALNPLQMVIASLNLTEEQQTEVFSLVQDYQSERTQIDIESAVELKKKQIRLVTQPDFDEAEMEKVIDTVQATEKSMVMQEMRLKNNIYNVLTEEQKEQFKTMMKSALSGGK